MSTPAFRGRQGSLGTAFTAACSLAWLLGTGPAGAAPTDNLSDSLRTTENGQQQIQTQTQELARQLQSVSAEFERNGLHGDEVKTLNLLSAGVGTMSEQEMTRIITLLRQARTMGDQRTVLQQAAAAYADQKNLTTEMKGLLTTFQKDQAAANLAASLTRLTERQAANLQTGVTAAQWSTSKKPGDTSKADLQAAIQVQASEQAALRDEAKQAAARLQAAASNPADPAAAKMQEALQKFGALNAALDQAAQDLQGDHLYKALTNEKTARDGMRQLARELTPLRASPGDALRQSQRDMADMIAQQKEMLAQTEKIQNTPTDADQWIKQQAADPKSQVARTLGKKGLGGAKPEELAQAKNLFNAQAEANKQALGALESKENELANRSDQVNQDLKQDAAPAAVAAAQASQQKIQEARADLDDRNAASAIQNQQAALAQMEQAEKGIAAQVAAQEAAQNASRTAQLQAAKQQLEQLAAQQQADAQQQAAQPQAAAANAAQEANLEKAVQALQDATAQAQSPAAAAALQQAANQMQKATAALSQPNGQPQAQAAEAAAAAALQQADTQVNKDIAQAAAAQQQLQQVDQVLASLEKIIAGQQKVQTSTTTISVKPAKAAKANAANAAQLAAQEGELKANTATLVLALNTPDTQPAVDPLNSAGNQMENSRAALAKANAAGALDPQRFAMTALLQAKELLNGKKSDLTQQTNPAAAAADQAQQTAQLADQIAQAQAQANAAAKQLAQNNSNQSQPDQKQNNQQPQNENGQPQNNQQNGQPQNGQQQDSQQQQSGQPQNNQQNGQQQNGDQQTAQPQQNGQPQQGDSQPNSQPQNGQPQGGDPPQTAQAQQNGQPQSGQPQGGDPPQTAQNSNQSPASQAAAAAQLQAAQQALDNAANLTGQAAADSSPGPMADALKQALADAQQALNQAASAAAKGDQATAKKLTDKAQQSLAQAQGQAQAAQSGLAQADSSDGSTPGKSQADGQQGSTTPAAKSSSKPSGNSSASASAQAQTSGGSNSPRDVSKIDQGTLAAGPGKSSAKPASAFAGLPARDRAALQQSQAEKYPQEFGSLIEQYMESLSDQPGS